MRKAITKRAVDAMRPGDSISDTQVQGFIVRRLPSGVITYGLRYRIKDTGKRRWLGLGLHGQITPDQARTLARQKAGEAAQSRDPLAEREAAKALAASAQTVADIIDLFMKEYANKKRLRSAKDLKSLFDRIVKPALGTIAGHELRKSDIAELLGKVEKRSGPILADRVLAALRRALFWYEGTGLDDRFRAPTFRGMAKTSLKERARERVLSESELREVAAALPEVNEVFAGIVWSLMYSAQRCGEIAGMRHSEIDGDRLTVPKERYKTKVDHVIPLTPKMLELIASQPRRARSDYVFTTTGKTAFSGFSKCKRALDAKIAERRRASGNKEQMPRWTLHDLRRTGRTLMAQAGVSSDIAERVLGHVIGGVRGTYDRHAYEAEKREALDRLGATLARILTETTGNVVALRRRQVAAGGTKK